LSRCGQHPRSFGVTIYNKTRGGAVRAQYGGVETCGSVWCCSVCAAKITERRRHDVAAVIAAHIENGGAIYMATFSMPHYAYQHPKPLRQGIAQAWQKLVAGAPWKRLKEVFGVQGYVRALEVTHGGNGWHPHLHVLIFTARPLRGRGIEDLRVRLFDRWATKIAALGFGRCSSLAFDLVAVNAGSGAADYVSKWGADAELTKAHVKIGKGRGGRTPWGILSDFAEHGLTEDGALFEQFARAFHGARQLTWSVGLRERYLGEEASDEEVAADLGVGPADAVALLTNQAWRMVVRMQLTAEILDAAESGGFDGVIMFALKERIPRDWIIRPLVKLSQTGA